MDDENVFSVDQEEAPEQSDPAQEPAVEQSAGGSRGPSAEVASAQAYEDSPKKWFIIHTYSGFEQQGGRIAAQAARRHSVSPIRSGRC